MPIYNYVCSRKHRTELIVPFSEYKEQIPCPRCNHGRKRVAARGNMAKIEVTQTAPPKFVRGVGGFHAPTN